MSSSFARSSAEVGLAVFDGPPARMRHAGKGERHGQHAARDRAARIGCAGVVARAEWPVIVWHHVEVVPVERALVVLVGDVSLLRTRGIRIGIGRRAGKAVFEPLGIPRRIVVGRRGLIEHRVGPGDEFAGRDVDRSVVCAQHRHAVVGVAGRVTHQVLIEADAVHGATGDRAEILHHLGVRAHGGFLAARRIG